MSEYVVENNTQEPAAPVNPPTELAVPESRKALVKEWVEKVKAGEKKWEKTFKQMRKCQKLARQGCDDDWAQTDKYRVPILTRHINQAVGQLYAKRPTTIAKRRKQLLFSVWDEKPSTAQAAINAFTAGDMTVIPLLQDIMQGQDYMRLQEKICRTGVILADYYLGEQKADYKTQLKALVRRTKTNAVGYAILGFQRQTAMTPELDAQIADVRKKLAETQRLAEQVQEENNPDASEVEQLQLNLKDLMAQGEVILREGPVIAFPKSTEIIIDPEVRHLKTLTGAGWWALKVEVTPAKGKKMFGKDVTAEYTQYKEKKDDGKECNLARFWKVQDGDNQQEFVICEGYPDFVIEPAEPDVKIERFFTLFPLIFNEVEDDENPFPDSDVWHARHAQEEYNRNRQGLREHRTANRPYYVGAKGALEEQDKAKLANHDAFEFIELNAAIGPDTDVSKIVQRGPTTEIDPAQYDAESAMQDVLRAVGSQEANIGPTSGATATETSIAENSRMSSRDDNVDDLDDFLTTLMHSMFQLMLLNLSKETVVGIAGPGAAWPEMAQTAAEIAKDLFMEVKAGSSGRPNQAAEIANMERAMPWVIQIPGIPPQPLAEKALQLLDIDPVENFVENLPSITAVNAMVGKAAAQQAAGPPGSDPNAQGPQGANNAPAPQGNEAQSQPAFPQAQAGNSAMTNQVG